MKLTSKEVVALSYRSQDRSFETLKTTRRGTFRSKWQLRLIVIPCKLEPHL